MRKPLALTMGDPAGCGPQITALAWSECRKKDGYPFFCIGPAKVFAPYCETKPINQPGEAASAFKTALPVLELNSTLPTDVIVGSPNPAAAPAILQSIETATQLALAGEVAGVVTNPIAKSVLYEAGFRHPGHTEYIANLCSVDDEEALKPVMMLVGGGLRVALATIHIPLMHAADHISAESLIEIAQIVDHDLRKRFGLSAPRIAFSGLNPHAGESGSIGKEEQNVINPAAAFLRQNGIDISNARPGDTVFNEALDGQFDAVIAMTHDQGLIPVKVLDFWGGVNTTLGLPIIRTSPDHGTAFDAAAAGTCRPDSLIAAIKLAELQAELSNPAYVATS